MRNAINFSGIVTLAVQLAGVAALAVLAALSVQWWGELPQPPPAPGVAGEPVAEGVPGFWAWFGLPLLGAAATVLLFALQALRAVMERRPWLISLPRQKAFAALPPPARSRVIRLALGRLSVFAVPINGFMIYGQWAQLEIANGRMLHLNLMAVAGFILAAIFAIAWYVVSIATIIGREEYEASARKS